MGNKSPKTNQEKEVKRCLFQFSDLNGKPRAVRKIGIQNIEKCISIQPSFDASSIDGFTGIAESDMHLKPDKEACYLMDSGICLICDVITPDHTFFAGDPRYILKQTLQKAKDMGYQYFVAPEYEFFLFEAENGKVKYQKGIPVPADFDGYFGIDDESTLDCMEKLIVTLESMDINVEQIHHEVTDGQQEIGLPYGDALKIADQVMIIKKTIKATAKNFGFWASFMPKPIEGQNGSGMHMHQNLANLEGKNIFYDKNGKYYNLSNVALNFIAGQLEYIKEITAVLNCQVNSFKRLIPNFEAPTNISWARKNRSTLIKIPSFSPQNARIELRSPDPACNPYLAFSLMLAAGLKGIEKNLTPPAPIEENIFHMSPEKKKELSIKSLPASLEEALTHLEKSELAKETLGEHTFHAFLALKKEECSYFRKKVTKEELNKYI